MDTLKAKVKTSRLSMDINGPLDSTISDVFVMISGKERREKVIADILKVHEDMTAREEGRK